jgi:hypothetical protein
MIKLNKYLPWDDPPDFVFDALAFFISCHKLLQFVFCGLVRHHVDESSKFLSGRAALDVVVLGGDAIAILIVALVLIVVK